LVDRSGERIDVTSHLPRHAGATVQRQQYGVPFEVLAEAMGHTMTADAQAPGVGPPSPRSSYDPLEGLGKRAPVLRVRALERALESEIQLRTTLAYNQQVLRSRILRLETELVLLRAERSLL
jgi:hypothetical protein